MLRELTPEIEKKIEDKARWDLIGFDEDTVQTYINAMKNLYKDGIIEVE